MQLSTLVLYEWLRGPRTVEEAAAREALFPDETTVVFGSAKAALAADRYRSLRRPRVRAADLAVAAGALAHGAFLWTLNPEDFADVPGLSIYRAA
jgi:predicted nucleic acid-binding protein